VPKIVSIVEGDGELAAVPILIRRIAYEIGVFDLDCYTAILTARDTFPRFASEREVRIGQARRDVGSDGAILVILDGDGEPPCVDRSHRLAPCVLGAELLEAVQPVAAGLPIAVVMAEREFEAWFLASAPSLIGPKGLRDGVDAHQTPDSLADPKGWLSERMRDAAKYRPSVDQARFTERFDMAMARERSPSFARAYEEIARLVRAVSQT
jgi:hypothetical protein